MIHQGGIVVGIAALRVAQLGEAKRGGPRGKEEKKSGAAVKKPTDKHRNKPTTRQRGTTATEMVNRTLKSNRPLRIQRKFEGKITAITKRSLENKVDEDRNKKSQVAIIPNKFGQLVSYLVISS